MTCLTANIASEFVEGVLNRSERQIAHRHVADCRLCRELLVVIVTTRVAPASRLGSSANTCHLS